MVVFPAYTEPFLKEATQTLKEFFPVSSALLQFI
jgi:hypothetical protein